MTEFLSNAGRLAYGVFGLLLYLWWRRHPQVPRWFWPALWVVTRVGGTLVLFVVLDLPAPTDAADTYARQARGAIDGLLPYRDFPSSFAPMSPAVLGLLFRLWPSPHVFVLAAVLLEGLLLLVWARWPPNVAGLAARRAGLAAYLCSTLPLNTALMGQDDVGIALLLTLLFVALDRHAWVVSAVGAGAMLVTTKFTSWIYLPLLAWCSGRLAGYAAVALAIAIPIHAAYQVAGANLLSPIEFEGRLFTNGNVSFLLSYFSPVWVRPSRVDTAITLLVAGLLVALIVACLRRRPSTRAAYEAIILAHLVLLVIFKKAYHTQLMLVMPALMIVVADRLPRWMPWLLALTTVSVTQQSVYFRLMKYTDLSAWQWTLAPWHERLFVATDVVMVAGYCALTVALFRTRPAER